MSVYYSFSMKQLQKNFILSIFALKWFLFFFQKLHTGRIHDSRNTIYN